MKNLSFGKYLNLGRCASTQGGLSILALDHRNNLRNALNHEKPEQVSASTLINFKLAVTKALSPFSSAVLLDPEIGAFQTVSKGTLARSAGLILALESTGYKGSTVARECEILPGWSVEKSKMLGANAAKLLVYYHPQSATAAIIEDLVGQVDEDCRQFDLPFILEILTYSIDPEKKRLEGNERRLAVIESSKKLSAVGGDLLKVEFPIDIASSPDEDSWADACAELTRSSCLPWVLLSASVSFDTYFKQAAVACQNGASGIAAGRAIWNEAVSLEPPQRDAFLSGEAARRIQMLSTAVDKFASPFSAVYTCPEAPADIYLKYPGN